MLVLIRLYCFTFWGGFQLQFFYQGRTIFGLDTLGELLIQHFIRCIDPFLLSLEKFDSVEQNHDQPVEAHLVLYQLILRPAHQSRPPDQKKSEGTVATSPDNSLCGINIPGNNNKLASSKMRKLKSWQIYKFTDDNIASWHDDNW